MKIAFITSDYLEVGGISQHIENLTYQVAKEHEVIVIYLNINFNAKLISKHSSIKLYQINHKNSKIGRFINYPNKEINQILTNEKPDLIHVHTLFDAFRLEKNITIPMIFTNHSSSYLKMYNNFFLKNFVLEKVLKKFQLIISPSTELYEKTIHNNKVMLANGVDIDRFDIEKRAKFDKKETLKKYQIVYQEEPIFLSTRRLVDKNGILDFVKNNLEYFKNNKVLYLLVGEGEHFFEIKNILEQNNIKNVYLLGKLDNIFVDELYYISDFCLIPSKMEAISISALEAMASGAIVIANKVGGLAELIIDKEDGLFLKDFSLKKTLKTLSKEDFENIKINASNKVKNTYNWKIIAKKTSEYYQNTINLFFKIKK